MGGTSCFNFSFVDMKMSFLRHHFQAQGLRPELVEVDHGATSVQCWVSGRPQPERGVWSVAAPEKPALLLLHDAVADGTVNWEKQIAPFAHDFHVYVPDLIFFGGSTSTSERRTEAFQAECMMKMLQALEVFNEVTVVGAGYGGLVAFWMAHLYPKLVERVVFVAAGTHAAPTSQKPLLAKFDYDHISELLVPTTAKGLRNLAAAATHKRVHRLPGFVCRDVLDVWFRDQRREKVELLCNVVCGSRLAPPLPRLTQDKTLIIWGENDEITGVDAGFKLSAHLGKSAELVVLKNCGHFPHVEQPQRFNRILHSFLANRNARPAPRPQSQR